MSYFRTTLRVLFFSILIVWGGYTITYFVLNGESLARLISEKTSHAGRGRFEFGYVRYPYWSGFFSIFLNTPAHVVGTDYQLLDPAGDLVLSVPRVDADAHLRDLVVSLLQFAATRQFHLHLHFSHATVSGGVAVIAPTAQTWGAVKPEMNIVAAMTAAKPTKSKGEFRITVDAVDLSRVQFVMAQSQVQPGKSKKSSTSLRSNPAWYVRLHDANATGHLLYSSKQSLETQEGPYFFFTVTSLGAQSGEFAVGNFHLPLDQTTIRQFGTADNRRQDYGFQTVVSSHQAQILANGFLENMYAGPLGVDLGGQLEHGAGLIPLLPSPLSKWLRGDPVATFELHGLVSAVTAAAKLSNFGADIEGLKLERLQASLDWKSGRLGWKPIVGQLGGGTFRSSGSVDVHPTLRYRGGLDVHEVALDQLPIPAWLKREFPARASGGLQISGTPEGAQVSDVDLSFVTARRTIVPSPLKLTGTFEVQRSRLVCHNALIDGEGVSARFDGLIGLGSEEIRGDFAFDVKKDSAWNGRLANLGLQIGESTVKGKVAGSLLDPIMSGHLRANQVAVYGRKIEFVEADFGWQQQKISLNPVTAEAIGGIWSGQAEFDLSQAKAGKTPEMVARLSVKDINLRELVGWKELEGRAQLSMQLTGPVLRPRGNLIVDWSSFRIRNDDYAAGKMVLELDDLGAHLQPFEWTREDGGQLKGQGRWNWDGTLDLSLAPVDFPLQAIPNISDLPVAIAGTVSGSVAMRGEKSHPQIGGQITLKDARVRDTLLGDGSLTLVPGTDAISIRGTLFGGVELEGYLTLFPKLTTVTTLRFTDLELERIFPEMKTLAEVRGLATGEARVSFDGRSGLTFADLRLTRLTLNLEGSDEEGASRHLVVRNRDDVLLSSDGSKLQVDQAQLTSPLGDFSILGQVAEKSTNVKLQGRIGLELLEYFFKSAFEHTHGNAVVDLVIQGNLSSPRLKGTIDLQKANLLLRGLEEWMTISAGRVVLDPARIQLVNVDINMAGALCRASGSVEVNNWVPGAVQGTLQGVLSAHLLEWLLPELFQETSGKIPVELRVSGWWNHPAWLGSAILDGTILKLREWDHEIVFRKGTLQFTPTRLTLGCAEQKNRENCQTLAGTIDEQPFSIAGWLELGKGSTLGAMNISVAASDVRFSATDFTMSFSPKFQLRSKDGEDLALTGDLLVTEGRYFRDFDLINQVILRPRTVERSVPFWVGRPMLENMSIDLQVKSAGPMYVKNNIADLSMAAALQVYGTLSSPRIGGTITVDEGGNITIPGFRIAFTSSRGQIRFDQLLRMPEETPTLDLGASGIFVDRNENSFTIGMRISGTVSRPQLFLSSNAGWDQNTILAVLVSGSTTEQLRALGRTDSSSAPGRPGTASATEGVIKTVTGLGVGDVLVDPIRKTLGLDVGTIEFGTGSVNLRLCKRFGRYLKTCGVGEVGFSTASRLEQQLELRISDFISALGRVEYLSRGIDTAQDSLTRGRLEMRLTFPLGY